MIKIKTMQQFFVEYEVPEHEYLSFMNWLARNDDRVMDYESHQEFINELIIYVSRNTSDLRAGSPTRTTDGGPDNAGAEFK